MKRKVCSVSEIKPVGSLVLVEILSDQEAVGTRLTVTKIQGTPPQAFVLDIGPAFKPADWGVKVGDRVILQGNYVPVPTPEGDRQKGIVEPHTIKCVLEESDE